MPNAVQSQPGREPTPAPRLHPYRDLLIIFAVAWALVLGYAVSDGELSILGHRLAKAELFAPPTDASEGDPIATAVALAAPPTPGAPPASAPAHTVDSAPQRILMLGDSMVENLMLRLADYARHNHHTLTPAIWYASTTTDWARDGKLGQLIREVDPTLVIVVLGSSELARPRIEELTPAVRSIVRRVGARKLVWVGPPNWREDSGINALLLRELGPRRFFRSADLHFRRGADGIHPTRESAAEWMDAIARWMDRDSDAPIRLETPTAHAARPSARVFAPPR